MNRSALDAWIQQKIGSDPALPLRPALEAWQLQKLNESLALVRARSSFYRKLFSGMPESLGSLAELAQFPFTTPEDVRRNPLQFVCVSQDDIQRVVTLQSSGTTGEPKRFYFTREDQELTIDFFDAGMTTLTRPAERVLILLPGETPGSVGDLLRLGLMRQARVPLPYGPVRDPLHALETMQTQQADCLVGSPTQILGLARRWQPGQHAPRTLLLSTDHVPQAIKKFLEDTWGCQVFNHYGATEMGLGGGVECEALSGYHLREADLYFEIIDPLSGAPVADGERGEVLLTTLTRRGMPLMRYRMGDSSRFVPGTCACGSQLKTMEIVRGRYSGFVPLGQSLLRMQDFDEALFSLPGVLNFRVTLTGEVGREVVLVETQMLDARTSLAQVQQALTGIPALREALSAGWVRVQSQVNPGEPGSLLKRTILDKRGQNA
ncbi:MAG: DVU_1553 family AMP-dependent CoA ligase [Chloroflexota bacterium]